MNVLWIAWRELRDLFTTVIGWLVMCGYLLVSGTFWFAMMSAYVAEANNLVFNPYAASALNLSDHLLAPFFGNCTIILLLVGPALSMRLFSEEYKQRTMALLLTSPVSTTEIVLGKYLGALGFVTVMLSGTLYVPATLYWFGEPEIGVLLGGYLALFLLTAAIIAMGTLASSLTENQIVALIVTFSGSLALYILSWLTDDPVGWQNQLSFAGHLSDLMRGTVRLSDLVYFAGFVFTFLFATHQRVASFRWS